MANGFNPSAQQPSWDDSEPQFFLGFDAAQTRAHLHECLEALRPQAGHVELLFRFGKMIFTDVPEDLIGLPLPIDAMYNVVRSRQVHHLFYHL